MIEVGSRWLDRETGRVAVILMTEVHGTGPAYHYENESEWDWHYCDLADFVLWNRWEKL